MGTEEHYEVIIAHWSIILASKGEQASEFSEGGAYVFVQEVHRMLLIVLPDVACTGVDRKAQDERLLVRFVDVGLSAIREMPTSVKYLKEVVRAQ